MSVPDRCLSSYFVFDHLFFFFRIALWLSPGKELITWLSVYAALVNAVLIVCIPFLFGFWSRM